MKLFVMVLVFCLSTAKAQISDEMFASEINKANVTHQLEQVAAGTLEKGQYERYQLVMERLVTLRPQNTNYIFSLAKAYALQGKKSEAYNALVTLQNAGFSYPYAENPAFDAIAGTEVYTFVDEGMVNNAAPYGEGQVVAEVPQAYSGMLFENMAYDKKGKRFILGSVRSGEVYSLTETGEFNSIIKPQTGENATFGVVDLVIDQDKDLIWTSSASMPQYNGSNNSNFGMATISLYRLSTGEWIKNIDTSSMLKPLLFNNLHLMASGELLFSNEFKRELMTTSEQDPSIKLFMSLPQLASVKAISSNSTGSIVYVSDYDQGLFAINVENKKLARLNDPTKAYLSGIDDLFYHEGDLVAVQTQTSPNRVMRILLKQDVLFQAAVPVESNNKQAKAMTKGVIDGDNLYYIGNSQWSKMDMAGNLREGESWEPLVIIKANNKYKIEDHLANQKRMEEIKKKRGIK